MSKLLSNIGYGATTAVIGLCVVFVGLILIIACIYGISFFIRKLTEQPDKKEEPKAEEIPAPVVEAVAAPAQEPEVETVEVTDDNELIAVIAAAIAAMDGGNKPLVIRSVRRVTGWKNAARAEQVLKY